MPFGSDRSRDHVGKRNRFVKYVSPMPFGSDRSRDVSQLKRVEMVA